MGTTSSSSRKSAKRLSSGWMLTLLPRRMSSSTKRRSWRKCALPSSPRCTKLAAACPVETVCQEVCQVVCQEVCQVARPEMLKVLHLDQQLKKSINLLITSHLIINLINNLL